MDNKERLKDVKNLEELVNFKVRTLADQMGNQSRAEIERDSR
jgi:hypothetical protein